MQNNIENKYYQSIFDIFTSLNEGNKEIQPTPRAVAKSISIIIELKKLFGINLSRPQISTTDFGGISCQWRNDTTLCELTIASSDLGKDSLFIRYQGYSSIEEFINIKDLVNALIKYIINPEIPDKNNNENSHNTLEDEPVDPYDVFNDYTEYKKTITLLCAKMISDAIIDIKIDQSSDFGQGYVTAQRHFSDMLIKVANKEITT